ncbi:hypothetical protein [Tahibacter aquaticus]|uniref:hypothetical protein n=1 Tax=Tahibacter aquaticus TaxID=520092 RepID=UPI001060F341|nr:hypothetical protein [Tahibacter aquaticus]
MYGFQSLFDRPAAGRVGRGDCFVGIAKVALGLPLVRPGQRLRTVPPIDDAVSIGLLWKTHPHRVVQAFRGRVVERLNCFRDLLGGIVGAALQRFDDDHYRNHRQVCTAQGPVEQRKVARGPWSDRGDGTAAGQPSSSVHMFLRGAVH